MESNNESDSAKSVKSSTNLVNESSNKDIIQIQIQMQIQRQEYENQPNQH